MARLLETKNPIIYGAGIGRCRPTSSECSIAQQAAPNRASARWRAGPRGLAWRRARFGSDSRTREAPHGSGPRGHSERVLAGGA
jgi:hypothetical protein